MDSTVERHGTYKGYDYLVLMIHGLHYCAYVRLPKNHPYYNLPYDDIPIDCHGGLTFSQMTGFAPLKKKVWKSRFLGSVWGGSWEYEDINKGYWIGWDYAHAGDYVPYMPNENDKKRTPDEIVLDAKHVIEQLIKAAVTDDNR